MRGAWRWLLASLVIAACARKPTVVAPTSAARWTSPSNPNSVAAVAFAGDVIYALTDGGRLRVWSGGAQAPRTLALQPVLALAGDGSVAVTATKEGKHGDRLVVWALASETPLCARSFDQRVYKVLALSATAAALRVDTGYTSDPNTGVPALPPPLDRGWLWRFGANTVGPQTHFDNCDDLSTFSEDGRRFVCNRDFNAVMWLDLHSGMESFARLAPDWSPPPPLPRPESVMDFGTPGKPGGPPALPYGTLSLRLSPNGDDVYVAYWGTETHKGWRLERWVPHTYDDPGPVVRLAAVDDDLVFMRLLAVSRDGRLAVLGVHEQPLVLRRAPQYDAQPLAARSATAAAVSRDGARVVSGHADGSLRLWDAPTGRLLATAAP